MLTQAKLQEILNYDPKTGLFTWKVNNKRMKAGYIAGCKDFYGYFIIRINNKNYKAHRLAWLYIYGTYPQNHIDHINGIEDDNRIENLRDVTNRANGQNRIEHRDGKLVGATYHNQSKKWQSRIEINGKRIHLGLYLTQQEAHEAYLTKLKELNNE